MDRYQSAQAMRLLVICLAWALGEALVWQLRAAGLGLIVPALLAAAAYVATRDITPYGGGGGRGGGGGTYWRGRRIDRDRWN